MNDLQLRYVRLAAAAAKDKSLIDNHIKSNVLSHLEIMLDEDMLLLRFIAGEKDLKENKDLQFLAGKIRKDIAVFIDAIQIYKEVIK